MSADIDNILVERGSRYGSYDRHAEITCALKDVIYSYKSPGSYKPYQRETLDMIMHKIGRIVNGDPNYADSWVDIAGYAKLVADKLAETS